MRVIGTEERFEGRDVILRLCTLDDCTGTYVDWLQDPEVSRYLETRWSTQSLDSIRAFVASMLASDHSYLFAIVTRSDGRHVGNVKVGPIVERHAHADVSYFIGDRPSWGRGLGTQAVRLATQLGFERLAMHRLQAGLYETNVGSQRVLEKAGYTYEGRLQKQLRGPNGWEDHVWFGALRESWR